MMTEFSVLWDMPSGHALWSYLPDGLLLIPHESTNLCSLVLSDQQIL